MSLADSIGLAETQINNGYFVTADHHELEIVRVKIDENIINDLKSNFMCIIMGIRGVL
jgi:hypothetical protein